MKRKKKLSKSMSVDEFESGYWYATELQKFAKAIGIPSYSKLRKDEVEKAIINFLKTGEAVLPTKRNLQKSTVKDSEGGLVAKKLVINYTNNKETKDWIVNESKRLNPSFKERSGARMRLNRWREEQITKGKKITYGDLAHQYVKINDPNFKYEKYPSGRYINFLSDFLKKEKNANREAAIAAWHSLKKIDIPKNYASWKKHKESSIQRK